MKALFELFRRFDVRRRFGFIRRLGGHVTSKSQVLRFAFYPRPPGGGRQDYQSPCIKMAKFLSTPSGWRATRGLRGQLWAGDDFYPRPPGGGRQKKIKNFSKTFKFLSTPSGWRATTVYIISLRALRFLSTPSGWRATFRCKAIRSKLQNFYPRPPGGGRLCL